MRWRAEIEFFNRFGQERALGVVQPLHDLGNGGLTPTHDGGIVSGPQSSVEASILHFIGQTRP